MMAGLRISVSLVACICLASYVEAYSSGAPSSACDSMIPSHGVAPQNSQSPYKVTTSKNVIMPGDQIEVMVSGDGNFKGFLIRARQNNNYLGGTFQGNSQAKLQCQNSAATHTGPTIKSQVKLMWTAPSNLGSGPVQFVATVVEQRTKFWTMITSADLTVSSGDGTSVVTSPPTTMISTSGSTGGSMAGNTNGQINNNDDDDDDDDGNGGNLMKNPGKVIVDPQCGKTKGCFEDCHDGGPCTYALSWLYEKDTVLFQFLFKTTSSTDQWIALGLSKDRMMGDDSVMECVMHEGKVLVKISYNTGKFNEYPDDRHAALSDYGGSVVDGVIACQMRRKIEFPREPKVFNLQDSYYMMVANGEAVAGNKFPHSYEKLPKVSGQKIDVKQKSVVRQGLDPLYPMVKTHGTAMTLAWMLFASSGLFIARHGKSMFNNAKPCGVHVWFHVHRFCMSMTAFLTVSGFVLILVESHGYSHIPDSTSKSYRILHPPLGLILIVLTIVNPLMALFRPEHKSPSRPMFNWTHWGCGIFAWLVSLLLLVIGLDLNKSQADIEAIYVVFAFIGYQLVIEILVRILPYSLGWVWGCCSTGWCRKKNSYDLNMTVFSSDELPRMTGNGIPDNKEEAEMETERALRRENIIKSIILVFHMLASACFAVAVLYFLLRRPVSYLTSTVQS